VSRLVSHLALAALLVATSAAASGAAEPPWVRETETDDGIVVFSRETPGTTVRAVKATLIVDAPPQVVLAAACDPETFRESRRWVEEQAFYPSPDPDVWFNYQRLNFPIVSRRDYTLRYERLLDPEKGLYRLRWKTTTAQGPPPIDGVVRVTLADGRIDITPVDGGKRARMHYYLHADPGGSIPGWIIDLANRVSLPTIIRDIRNEAVRRAAR